MTRRNKPRRSIGARATPNEFGLKCGATLEMLTTIGTKRSLNVSNEIDFGGGVAFLPHRRLSRGSKGAFLGGRWRLFFY
jgi:hypothetical protein